MRKREGDGGVRGAWSGGVGGENIGRLYTLSSSPSRPGRLAVSVKRIDGGRVSNWLVDNLQVGDSLTTQSPDGSFHLTEEHHNQPLLLLSAGSGVTPMLSMLRYLTDTQQVRDVVFSASSFCVEEKICL